MFKSGNEVACNTVLCLQGDVEDCNETTRERLEQLAGQGGLRSFERDPFSR